MKIAINRSYMESFEVSLKALVELVKREAYCIGRWAPDVFYAAHLEWNKDTWEQKFKDDIADFTDIGDGMKVDYTNRVIFKDGLFHFFALDGKNGERVCKDLIDVIETMGEEANGGEAKLKVVEIPDDIKWYIHDNNFCESVYEVHQYWE